MYIHIYIYIYIYIHTLWVGLGLLPTGSAPVVSGLGGTAPPAMDVPSLRPTQLRSP